MFHHKTGNGPRAVVGLHGWSGDHRTFDPLLGRMPAGFSFWALDLPGCGKSDPPKQWEMRSLAAEVACEILGWKQKDITLLGSCSGAVLAAFVVREFHDMGQPAAIKRLVMLDPFAFCPWYFRIFLIPVVGPMMYAAAFANPMGRWITNLSLRDKRAGDTDLTQSFSTVNHRVVWRYLKMLSECGRPGQFRGLGIPLDILFGEKTFGAVRCSVEEWAGALPQARIRKLPGVGHLPINEGSSEVARVVFQ